MIWLDRIKKWLKNTPPTAVFDRSLSDNPLREFVYLDEVSLRSLLSSKNGEMTSTTSREITESFEGEYRNSASFGATNVGKAESTARFQTRNSSTLQTAKKATVQSWFRELDKIRGIRLLETVRQVRPFLNSIDIAKCPNSSVAVATEKLKRGEIVEFRVCLSADPIFHLVTIISEFKGMAEDYPDMLAASGGLKQFGEIEGISRVLQRLLAGLIPVKAQVLDYVIVEIEGIEYLTHVDSIKELEVEQRPLEIVCVTELDAYWKDIRRVLFSGAEFTMLARMSKSGIQEKWTPIKLADLLSGLVPDLSDQLDSATRLLFDPNSPQHSPVDDATKLRSALTAYAESLLVEVAVDLNDEQQARISTEIAEFNVTDHSTITQTNAFKAIGRETLLVAEREIDPQKDLELREAARKLAHFPYFDSKSHKASENFTSKPTIPDAGTRFLDVEVVAMYW